MAEHTRRIDPAGFAESPVILRQLQQAFDDLDRLAREGKVRYVVISAAAPEAVP